MREQLLLDNDELQHELLRMTDAYTDELFSVPSGQSVIFPLSRLVVDVERFPNDDDEPMAKVGMGAVYTKTSDGRSLRRPLSSEERGILMQEYRAHHEMLRKLVLEEISTCSCALIVDCHSFPSTPLPCDQDQRVPRPDFCVGTVKHSTPEHIITVALKALSTSGFTVALNAPYAGSMLPLECSEEKDPHIMTIMIEVNRQLYMDEATGEKKDTFPMLEDHLRRTLEKLRMVSPY
ncbi:MAG TPA: N-formylglutamate amidohydrolase [Thermodesulfobacteriota bacterium]|nr:N-formylglutamate amidohydrolase [Thermodesulfobacteriota bacterium]HNU72724.1 N-formylglutamate amidohydrolase [Thermodesulfobacteriota bacterium]